jgi:uncharacterized membrane protein YeaQ/YmgE (transglycosylase-associated protein family)
MPDANSLLYIILIGLAAGVLANFVIPTSIGLLGAIVVGIIGSAIGFYFFPALGFHVSGNPTVAAIVTSTVGSIIFLFVLRVAR